MNRPLTAATVYFLALFALGFVLGTLRVLFVAPRIGDLAATLLEVPVMLTAAFILCRWAIGRWQVSPDLAVRGAMVLWFLLLLVCMKVCSALRCSGGRWATYGQGWRRLPGWSG